MIRSIAAFWSRLPAWARQGVLAVALLAGLVAFAAVANEHYPLKHWLLFVYVRIWLLGLLFVLASLAAGWRLVAWLLPEPPALDERLMISFAVGVLVFVLGLFLSGIIGWLGTPLFFAWPALLLLFGGRRLVRDARRIFRRLRPFGFRLLQPRNSVEAAAAVSLVLGVCAIYLQVVTPANVGADSQWYHLSIAEQYATTGRIRPFVEGWYLGAIPQLSSLVYMWGFLSPGKLFDHVALASHLEWFLFLATLAGVSVLTRRLLRGARMPYAAAAVFLFPGIFLYDSSLATMADHVMAFWGPPLALALLRLRRWFAPREAVVAALVTSGAALTKYQSSYMVAGAILVVTVWTIRRRRLIPAALFAVTGIVVTSAHWLKNLVFYGDPLYPFLHSVFPSHPFREGAERFVSADHMAVHFALKGTPAHKLRETLKALFTWSFVSHDWYAFHGDRPVFGSLFTLLLPVLLFVRAAPELWLTAAGVHLGIAIWFMTSHEDRYLQSLLPWMAACTAALLALVWRRGNRPVRGAIVALVAFQVVWGADVYFIRTHAMIGESFLKRTVDHMAAGHEKRYEERFRVWGGLQDIAPQLPAGSKVLIHEIQEKLGIGKPVVADWDGWQLAIDYFKLPTPESTLAMWRSLGVTHVIWHAERGASSYEEVAKETVFVHAMDLFGLETRAVGGYNVATLASTPTRPGAATPTRVAWLGCGGDPPAGIYLPGGIVSRRPERALSPAELASDPGTALTGVSVVVLRPACADMKAASAEVSNSFRRVLGAGDVALWVRTR